MMLQIAERNGRWFWRLYDTRGERNKLVARGATGYASWLAAKDYARYTWEGLRNIMEPREPRKSRKR